MFCISPAQTGRLSPLEFKATTMASLPLPSSPWRANALLLAKAEQQQRKLRAPLDRVGVAAQQQQRHEQELARAQQQLADEQAGSSSASLMML